jgi:hypothetical protein
VKDANSRTDPLRLPKDVEEFERTRDAYHIGVSGTLYPGEEATVVLAVDKAGWHYMDVQYAKQVCIMLIESIRSAEAHNKELKKKTAKS